MQKNARYVRNCKEMLNHHSRTENEKLDRSLLTLLQRANHPVYAFICAIRLYDPVRYRAYAPITQAFSKGTIVDLDLAVTLKG